MDSSKKIAAEFIGTFWLVLGGCGSAVLAAGVPDVGIGYLGVALAFGLTVGGGAGGCASNGYGEHSPQHYTMIAGLICEIVMTFIFLVVILNTTLGAPGMAPLAIGLTLTLIHLISIPVTNTSVNPARSIGVAIFQGGWALEQLWLFIVAPLIGAGLAGVFQHWFVATPAAKTSQKLAS